MAEFSSIFAYFNTKELLQAITIPFYNTRVKSGKYIVFKQFDEKLRLTASACALHLAIHYSDPMISFLNLLIKN
jgi:hypothetical protein